MRSFLSKDITSIRISMDLFSCGYNVNKRKHELSKIKRKKINFKNRLIYAEVKMFSVSVDLNKIYEGDDFDEIYEVLLTLKNKKL